VSLYALSSGCLVEVLGDGWVAYSAPSGETLVLNTEAVAVLETLSDGPQDEEDVARALANQADLPVAQVRERLHGSWPQLLSAGLISRAHDGADNAA